MCTLTFAWRVFRDAPVLLGANRDEAVDRPAEPPAVRGETTRYVAPRDAKAGGTWIGLNECGLVVAITNRWLESTHSGDRSRGLLVADCLASTSAEAAVTAVRHDLERRSYDGFNLLLADSTAAFVLEYDRELTVRRLDPGVHVIGNVGGVINGSSRFSIPTRRQSVGAERADSARRIATTLVPDSSESGTAWLDRASEVLADHEYDACLHGDGFGTVSCTRIQTGTTAAKATMAYADGPPCEATMKPVDVPEEFGRDADETEREDDTESQF